jgi:hypothetical protein
MTHPVQDPSGQVRHAGKVAGGNQAGPARQRPDCLLRRKALLWQGGRGKRNLFCQSRQAGERQEV